MSKEIEMYLEKNHLSYNSAIRNNVGELVGIGDLIDQNTKPLIDEIAELRKALNQIQDYQMDFVELARTTTVYKIAESALNKLKASKSESTTNELELSVRIRQYIEKTHESDITPESLTKVFLDNYKPKLEANEVLIDVDKNTDSDTWFINNLIGLAHTKLALLKENKIESIDRIELSNWINKHIKQAKSEANEAVEFAYFILDNYTQNTIGWHHNNWSGDLETYVNYSPKQLYEIFKTRNNK